MICLKIRTFVVSATTYLDLIHFVYLLWFAWKFVPLWYQQQHGREVSETIYSCDLLENSYLCGISNNNVPVETTWDAVVICLKIRTFVVSATTEYAESITNYVLWFAWKFVPLWYQQQHAPLRSSFDCSCDLLENSYLCGISNNFFTLARSTADVVICLKIRTFVVSATTAALPNAPENWLWFAWKFVPLWYQQQHYNAKIRRFFGCDLLENSYLCGISNNTRANKKTLLWVVICLKIRTFVVSATTSICSVSAKLLLWFAWKFVPLWYQQQQIQVRTTYRLVVICLKIRTFVVSATTFAINRIRARALWFAWKFVPLWYQQQLWA